MVQLTEDGVRNLHAVRTLEEVAEIMYLRGLIPSPEKRLAAYYEQQALQKLRERAADLEEYIDESVDGDYMPDEDAELRVFSGVETADTLRSILSDLERCYGKVG
jgi:hypothetical protein